MKALKSALSTTLFLSLLPLCSLAQSVSPSSPADIQRSSDQRSQLRETSIFKNYPVRSVGPIVMSGRVTDIAVHPENSRIFYIGLGSGGVFKTTNNGNTMEPIFDHAGDALGIGDLAISRANPDVIWVGTGENNSSRSTYAGFGVYRSTDAGKTWNFAGLRNSQHIGRIVTHPTDENIAWVASVGALFSNNSHRGVFKTTDGGQSWEKTLFINDSTGVIDLVIHPEDPDILWAAAWEKDRKAWNFKESGESSGIYKSMDGGVSWEKLSNGLPDGAHVGRIGLDISQSDPDIIYAVIDNQYETKTEREIDPESLTLSSFIEMGKDDFLKLDNDKLNSYLRSNRFPEEHTAESVKKDIRNDKYPPRALADYVGDANAALFNTEIIGPEVYRSNNGGDSWAKVNSYDLDGVFYTYGYYFGQIRVDPNDPETIYIWGVPFLKSTDGGKTWAVKADNQSVHVDHHAMWIDPDDSEHILLGNDGGLYESHDGTENFIHHNVIAAGQFYTVNVDMETPYNIYGGLQDNGTYKGSSRSVPNRSPYWTGIGGGDGMHVAPNPKTPEIVYVGSQYGNYGRRDSRDGSYYRITPSHQLGEPRYRYNWNTPMNLSSHNPEIIYIGSQRLNRSFDEGKTWTAISPDLTHDLPNGDVPYSTISTIGESPIDFNLIWIGTDDGNIQLTKDGGANWTNVTVDIPENLWVSEVHPSKYDKAVAYVSLNGYRYDNFSTFLYKTNDFGKTWNDISGNLPDEVVNVIYQDPVNPKILYAGMDHGTYISFNDGREWHYLTGIPNVASYDLLVHPRDLELVVGTHGRSIWVADVKPLHEIADRLDEPVTALKTQSVRHSNRWGSQSTQYREPYMPEVSFMYFLGSEGQDQKVTVELRDEKGKKLKTFNITGNKGFNTLTWNLVVSEKNDEPEFLGKGTYTLTFKNGRNTHETDFKVE